MCWSVLSLASSLSLHVHRCEKRQQEGGGTDEGLEESGGDDHGIIDDSKLGPPFGIVINGHSLVSI